VIVVCLQRRKRGGKRKGWVVGEGEGGGSGAESAWKRQTGGEGGLARRSVATTGPWPMGVGKRRTRVRCRAREVGSLTRGPENIVTGGAD
jgi:hypothetical protein